MATLEREARTPPDAGYDEALCIRVPSPLLRASNIRTRSLAVLDRKGRRRFPQR